MTAIGRDGAGKSRPDPQPLAPTGAAATPDPLRHQLRGMSYAEGAARLAPVQARGGALGGAQVQETAARGVEGASGGLPHLGAIQRAFGQHDVSGVRVATGEAAQRATGALGAEAYATGDSIALGAGASDLHTVAHEAAHVVQQRAGVQLSGGVGQAGDAYERQADEVADRVVAGQSAESLLGAPTTGGAAAVQRSVQLMPDPERTALLGLLGSVGTTTREDLARAFEGLGWRKSGSPDGRFMHFRDGNGLRARLDPPDAMTAYWHLHLFDTDGTPLDVALAPTTATAAAAHIRHAQPAP